MYVKCIIKYLIIEKKIPNPHLIFKQQNLTAHASKARGNLPVSPFYFKMSLSPFAVAHNDVATFKQSDTVSIEGLMRSR